MRRAPYLSPQDAAEKLLAQAQVDAAERTRVHGPMLPVSKCPACDGLVTREIGRAEAACDSCGRIWGCNSVSETQAQAERTELARQAMLEAADQLVESCKAQTAANLELAAAIRGLTP